MPIPREWSGYGERLSEHFSSFVSSIVGKLRGRTPAIVHVNEAQLLVWRGGETRVLVKGEDTLNAYSMLLVTMDAGQERPVPCPSEIGYYLLQGHLAVATDTQDYELTPGAFVNVPRHYPHEVRALGDSSALFLTIVSPAVEDLWVDDRLAGDDDWSDKELSRKLLFRPSAEGRSIKVLGHRYNFKVVGSDTLGAYSLWEVTIPPGASMPSVLHSREEKAFFILEGTLTLQVARKRVEVNPGTLVNLPKDWLHSSKNESDAPVKALNLIAPAGLEELFLEIGDTNPMTGDDDTDSKGEITKLRQLGPRYGLDFTE